MKQAIIHIKFLDHSSGPVTDATPIECDVFGVLWKEDKQCYYVASWVCNGNLGDHNSDGYTILKSAVIKKRTLR